MSLDLGGNGTPGVQPAARRCTDRVSHFCEGIACIFTVSICRAQKECCEDSNQQLPQMRVRGVVTAGRGVQAVPTSRLAETKE